MSATVLSPLAAPFHPTTSEVIFNDGIPSLVNVQGVGEVLFGISDDAIDEIYPPTAEEIAEIEAAEIFVEVMAHLSLLEEKEEQARLNFGHIKKRWEKRREEGLRGRPKPASNVSKPIHTTALTNKDEKSLVAFHHFRAEKDQKTKINELKKFAITPKRIKGMHGFSKTIQQPRKHS